MKKKMLSVILAAVLMLNMAACGGQESGYRRKRLRFGDGGSCGQHGGGCGGSDLWRDRQFHYRIL